MGHPILAGLAWALQEEYVFEKGPIVGRWWDSLDKSKLYMAGTSPEAFEAWFPQMEDGVRIGQPPSATVVACRQVWGV